MVQSFYIYLSEQGMDEFKIEFGRGCDDQLRSFNV
jgi:hypothetical protein